MAETPARLTAARPLWCPVPPAVPFGQLLARDWRRQAATGHEADLELRQIPIISGNKVICFSKTRFLVDGLDKTII